VNITINDLLNAGRAALQAAKKWDTQAGQAAVLKKALYIIQTANDALETGYWSGKDRDRLHKAKRLAYAAQNIAKRRVHEYFNYNQEKRALKSYCPIIGDKFLITDYIVRIDSRNIGGYYTATIVKGTAKNVTGKRIEIHEKTYAKPIDF